MESLKDIAPKMRNGRKMKLTENMLSEATRKVSEELVEKWERENADCTHQFSEEFEKKMSELISKKNNNL